MNRPGHPPRGTAIAVGCLLLSFASRAIAGPPGGAQPYASLTASSGIDTNVRNGNGPDLVSRLMPAVGVRLTYPRLDLDAQYQAAYFDYAFGKATSSWNHKAALTLDGQITRLTAVHADDRFVYAYDPAAVDLATPELVTGGILDEGGTVSLYQSLGRRLAVSPQYYLRLIRFSGDLPDGSPASNYDSLEQQPGLALDYSLSRRDVLGLGDAFAFFSGPGARGTAHEPFLSFTHAFDPRLDLRLQGGPAIYQQPGGGALTWHALGRLRVQGERWRVAALYDRDLLAGGFTQTLWAEAATLQLTASLSRLTDLDVYATGYRDGIAPSGADLIRGVAAEADVEHRLGHQLLIGASLLVRDQEIFATAAGAFVAANRVIVGLHVTGVVGGNAPDISEVP